MTARFKSKIIGWKAFVAAVSLVGSAVAFAVAVPATPSSAAGVAPSKTAGMLDCNGFSPEQKTLQAPRACTDIRGAYGINNKNTWGGRFYDNGHYIGHDEPDVRFLSPTSGSGDNVVWNETLGMEPTGPPTVKSPGHDTTHYTELTIAPWFSMALCDPYSYPQLPCQAESDKNAPASSDVPVKPGEYPGAGSSFLEMQFYPPGMAPFEDNISCDNTHWCASLHINDLECTTNFASCNLNCEEPTNFAFIQENGVPTGPPSPQLADIATSTPNNETLLMNPGDHLRIHIWDAPVPGDAGQMALETSIDDLTTGQSGYMQASAANGFMATDMSNCDGVPFNYQPEYNTAAVDNIVPWAADQVDVSTEFEIGHFEPCNSVSDPIDVPIPGYTDVTWNKCHGVYENTAPGNEKTEPGDAFCYTKGDTHYGQAPPNIVTGCEDDLFQNGDLDFDGTSYWPDWPDSTVPNTFPSTFQESPPTTHGGTYAQFQFQTDIGLSETETCKFPVVTGCTAPPPNAPGKFYPYWTLTRSCTWEFGQMANGNSYGKDAQYGTAKPKIGYAQIIGPVHTNPCASS